MADKKSELKILIVEDSDIFRNIVSELLADHTIKSAKTIEDGYKKYIEFAPHLTLLDISLPDGSGHDLLIKIRTLDKNAYVVMMTASRLKEDILQSMKEGAQGYVVKPFSGETLIQCIDEYYTYSSTHNTQQS
jgi:two-component system, chemotaxis family, chemotaxis protein CheY